MYEEHFGLSSRPFGAKAEGKDVFIGPGQTKTIARMHKGQCARTIIAARQSITYGQSSLALDDCDDERFSWIHVFYAVSCRSGLGQPKRDAGPESRDGVIRGGTRRYRI